MNEIVNVTQYTCLWRKGINKLRFHPDKPVSWLPTHQGI